MSRREREKCQRQQEREYTVVSNFTGLECCTSVNILSHCYYLIVCIPMDMISKPYSLLFISTQECCAEEEQLLEGFQASIQSLSELFRGIPAAVTDCQVATPLPEIPPTQQLEEQFIARPAILQTEEEPSR